VLPRNSLWREITISEKQTGWAEDMHGQLARYSSELLQLPKNILRFEICRKSFVNIT